MKVILYDSRFVCYWINQTIVPLNISNAVKLKLTEMHIFSGRKQFLKF